MEKVCKKCLSTKPTSEFYVFARNRDGFFANCKSCHKNNTIQKRRENKGAANAYARMLYAKNIEKSLARAKKYRDENRDKVLEAVRKSYRKHNVKRRAKAAEWYQRTIETRRAKSGVWAKANPAKAAAASAKRKAWRIKATPAWANDFFIGEIYDLCQRRNKLLSGGVLWNVDHIVPLKSKFVCGLHVEHNLRVIPKIDNLKKKNTYWPNMPCQT